MNPSEPYTELSPMLCFSYELLKPSEKEVLWHDDSPWLAQEKYNGVRAILQFVRDQGIVAYTRNKTNITDRLLFSGDVPDFSATVDTEAVINKPIVTPRGETTKSSLHSTSVILRMVPVASKCLQLEQAAPLVLHVFDITNWQGMDLRSKPLCERLSYLSDFRLAMSFRWEDWFQFPPVRFQGKKAFFDEVLARGGEGAILKNLNSPYIDSTSRSRSGWIKVKKSVSFDCFVSGFGRGHPNTEWHRKVGYLAFSIHTEKGPHEIARVTNFPFHIRKRISIYDPSTDQVSLSPDAMGRVAKISGLEVAQRSFRVSHPRILAWKGELTAEQCRYSWGDVELPTWSSGSIPLRLVGY